MTDPSLDEHTPTTPGKLDAAHGGHEHDLDDPVPPGEKPGLEQQELRDAAEEGPHGSHDDAHRGPVEHARRGQGGHEGHKPAHGMPGHDHHAMMVEDFKKRFWVALALTVPILALSPMLQRFLGLRDALAFTGHAFVLWGSRPSSSSTAAGRSSRGFTRSFAAADRA